nr:hypothetical protein [Tanacetum cinerariifolium]
MAISITRLTFFALLVCSFAMILNNKVVSAQCSGDMQGLMEQCASHITNEVEGIISMEKSAFIAQACGKPLVHGTRCGSYIVP